VLACVAKRGAYDVRRCFSAILGGFAYSFNCFVREVIDGDCPSRGVGSAPSPL
jgi:hypothetical protein